MTRTTEREAISDLAEVLGALPLIASVDRPARGPDLVLKTADGRSIAVAVRSLRSPAPSDIDRLGDQDPAIRPLNVLVSDRIIPRVRDELRSAGWNWLDRRGHLFLAADGLLIDTDVPSLHTSGGRSRPILDTEVGLDVGSALLTSPSRNRSIRDLVAFTGRSLGAVHRAVRGLSDEGLIGEDGRPLAPELFWEVSSRWRPVRMALARGPKRDDARQVRQLGMTVDVDAQAPGWALTDTRAASAFGAGVVTGADHPPDFYVPDERSMRIARQILGDAAGPDTRAATVALSPVGWACQLRIDPGPLGPAATPWPLAHPVIVALDLSTDTSRGREILDGWSPPKPFERVW